MFAVGNFASAGLYYRLFLDGERVIGDRVRTRRTLGPSVFLIVPFLCGGGSCCAGGGIEFCDDANQRKPSSTCQRRANKRVPLNRANGETKIEEEEEEVENFKLPPKMTSARQMRPRQQLSGWRLGGRILAPPRPSH